jgi:hypothetical protein
MEAADYDTLHICLVALGPLFDKVVQVEGVRLVPRNEVVVAADDRYRTVPVGVWVLQAQDPNPSVDLGLDPVAEEALHNPAVDISVPAVVAFDRREAFRRRAAFLLHYRLLL